MSLVTKNTRPITTDDLLREILTGRLARETLLPLGVNNDGTIVTIHEPSKRRGRIVVPGKLHAYTITDLPTASGGFSISNFPATYDVSDRAARLLGTIANAGFNVNNFPAVFGSIFSLTNTSFAGDGSLIFPAAPQGFVLKTAVLNTAPGGSSRSLNLTPPVAGLFISAKSAAPGAGLVDMLDREVAIAGGATITVTNGLSVDRLHVTYLRVL